MRIATWNLARPSGADSARGRRLAEWMQTVAADVWILTETHETIRPGPEYVSAATVGSDRAAADGERWTMIWSRLPITNVEPTADPIRSVCARIEFATTGHWLVYGTVLPWRTDRNRLPLKGAEAFVDALGRQRADWEALRSRFPNDRLCVGGDFNQEFATPICAGSKRGREALSAALSAARLSCPTAERNDPVARLTAGARQTIDHLCVDATNDELSVGAWPPTVAALRGLTDHFGTWVDVPL